MSTRLFAFHCGAELCPERALDPDAPEDAGFRRMPYSFYLIEHGGTLIAFDTGPNPDFIDRGVAYIGPAASSWRVELCPRDDARSQLHGAGIDIDDVSHVVMSHLHYDHAGGMALFRNARFWVQRDEWDFAIDAAAQRTSYVRSEFDVPSTSLTLLDGDHDLFGDGMIMLLSTPGHTPGHQSLLVAGLRQPSILAADAAYLSDLDDRRCMPGPAFIWDPREMQRSIGRLRRLRDERQARVFVTHEYQKGWRAGAVIHH